MTAPPDDRGAGMDDPVERLRADYDATPYTSNSFPQSSPGQLAAVAHLFGLDTPKVSSARVLEIGCATGGNLIPFAATHPRARVVGVDLSEVQIDMGRTRVKALGIDNLELVAGDIARMDLAALGQFDYVVAHGVYSWVPADVREALFAALRSCMAPDGVAYVSYNVYPGWKSKEILRDAMLLASGASTNPDDKAREARGMLDFLEEVVPADGVMARVVAESKAFAEGFGDSYLLHDELETYNTPCYFYEMVTRASAHGLAYLAEARPETMVPANFGPKVAEYVNEKSGGVQVLVDQYLDFVTNRMFRETLLIHGERASMISYNPDRNRFGDFYFAAFVPPLDEPTRLDNTRQEYVESDGATLFTNDPGIKAALDALSAAWPWTLSRQELVDAVSERFALAGLTSSSNLADHVDNLMGTLILQGQARYRLAPVVPESTLGPLQLDEMSRRMAELTRDQEDASTFNPWHETEMLSAVDRHVLPLLDGTRDRDALVDALLTQLQEGVIPLEREALADYVDELPERLREMKLL